MKNMIKNSQSLTRSLSKKIMLLALLSLVNVSSLFSDVSIRNGNFYISYIDIEYSGGFDPKIERVYNSKAIFDGMFGFGWGSEYETKLDVSVDGSVVVSEAGGGAQNRFSPSQFNAKELDAAVEMIAGVARGSGGITSAEQLAAYKNKLKTDATYRNDEWAKFKSVGKLKARQLPAGTKLISNRFSYQTITKVTDGYIRSYDSGKSEKFDEAGHLVKVTDKNNNFIDFKYNASGKMDRIIDNFNRKIFITYNNKGKVEKLEGESKQVAFFKYNGQGELVYSKDTDNNVYEFVYSTDGHHNLTQVKYQDKTTLDIAYYGKEQNENVKSVKDRDGSITEYGYKANGNSALSVTVKRKEKNTDGSVTTTDSSYDYTFKNKADGEQWTSRIVETINGEKTDTTYNECCGLPISIKKGNSETAFEYDAQGRVLKKATPEEVTELTYDKVVSKVSKVLKYPKNQKNKATWSTFSWDAKGNLQTAKNHLNKAVKLFYDTNGRISTMIDQSKRRIDFKYNENSKPIVITDPALGSINVTYDNAGAVTKVESAKGDKVAVQIFDTFQNLIEIIRPAGVTLSF